MPDRLATIACLLALFCAERPCCAAEVLPVPGVTPPLPADRETVWSAWIARELGGVAEHRCFDGSRVDVLTDQFAVEVEWVSKWEQAIGQAALYAELTGREPAVLVLYRDMSDAEQEDGLRCVVACRRLGIETVGVDTRRPLDALVPVRRVLRCPELATDAE